jgi:hypothetical protein
MSGHIKETNKVRIQNKSSLDAYMRNLQNNGHKSRGGGSVSY